MKKALILIVAAASLGAVQMPDTPVQVCARVDKTEVQQGEKVIFEITLSGPIREAPEIRMSKLEGFGLVSTSQSQQVRMQAGEVSRTLILTYTLSALEAGARTLGAVTVEVQGKSYETAPIEIKVLPGPPAKKPIPRVPKLEGEVIL